MRLIRIRAIDRIVILIMQNQVNWFVCFVLSVLFFSICCNSIIKKYCEIFDEK